MPQGRKTQWPYMGYEDYTPQGRSAIEAFNAASGPMNLYSQGGNATDYMNAVMAARRAALARMLMEGRPDNPQIRQGMIRPEARTTWPTGPSDY